MTGKTTYRTHTCGEIGEQNLNCNVRLSGWVENIRDHGGIQFLDLRDHYGVVQVVIHEDSLLDGVSRECTVSVAGTVVLRDEETINPKIASGIVEVRAESLTILGKCLPNLPFEVASSKHTKEDVRLQYRFLDLRNPKVHQNIVLRAEVISFLRSKMQELGFLEIQTPILSASSPEGARDYLIPSRRHHGKFYALPQAPQIFKQLLMVSGFDRYFQIAPCFRDEDARADRSPGEFYQLDFEMAFASQEDVFAVAEAVLPALFTRFSEKAVTPAPFPRIPYAEAMLRYGTDKPDLRNPLVITDISDLFVHSSFRPFSGKTVRVIAVPDCAAQSRTFFGSLESYAESLGMGGLGYVKIGTEKELIGPLDKYMSESDKETLLSRTQVKPGDVIFFIADREREAAHYAGLIRTALGERLSLIADDAYRFCFITDFPMYEIDEETGAYAFTHNPFSMPQGGMQALCEQAPETILAYQYDIVCNGVELSSGAVRNHDIEIMKKAFSIAGYSEAELEKKFHSLYNAFQYGAPPHAGMAPGIDRMLMLLCGEESIREVIAFPMNSNAQDVLLGAPGEVTEQQLREAHIKIR
ncbi:aspartate--tRNA ligase [Yeguia hominis]|uniref:Aspartate--tRNA(Asp/Asn) ligase n=1 Tax=Yeguia hominis TaxID=2763662 RepID=A0A926D648_9FIRM|nr:aspartate--tRNA ligase [Yeguia hominis]MBC8532418.1 aspartate--tRNA ligase [Yeguia hominis]